jgi:hypothetical protein
MEWVNRALVRHVGELRAAVREDSFAIRVLRGPGPAMTRAGALPTGAGVKNPSAAC